MSSEKIRHAHELEAAGEPRWQARLDKSGLLMVKDLASLEEVQATAYTLDGDQIRFSLPGEAGLRTLNAADPGFDAFKAVLEEGPQSAPTEEKPSRRGGGGSSGGSGGSGGSSGGGSSKDNAS